MVQMFLCLGILAKSSLEAAHKMSAYQRVVGGTLVGNEASSYAKQSFHRLDN